MLNFCSILQLNLFVFVCTAVLQFKIFKTKTLKGVAVLFILFMLMILLLLLPVLVNYDTLFKIKNNMKGGHLCLCTCT